MGLTNEVGDSSMSKAIPPTKSAKRPTKQKTVETYKMLGQTEVSGVSEGLCKNLWQVVIY